MPGSNMFCNVQRKDRLIHFRLRSVVLREKKLGRSRSSAGQQRRGVTIVFAMLILASLTVVAAFALELEHLSISRTELQRSADATALGACWQLFDDTVARKSHHEVSQSIKSTASTLAAANVISNQSPQLSEQHQDVQLGSYNLNTGEFSNSINAQQSNAVRITLRRQASINGEVPLFFSKLLGRESQPMQTSATAAMFSQITGFYTPGPGAEDLQILPIALDIETWQDMIQGKTSDLFTAAGTSISRGPDGLHECNLFPQGTGSAGNRGTVDISDNNNSTSVLSRQILHGISREDMLAFGRPLEFDNQGELLLNGNTGISAAIKDELESIVGQKRIIPIFSSVVHDGNTAWYTIVAFEGVRILEVTLTGAMDQKRLIVQPAPTVARGAVFSPSALQSSHTLVTPVMLVE
jgi:hypothetical protein